MSGSSGWEIDHWLVVTSPGAPAADRLRDAGFAEGPPNRHPGQGTACRRFLFANAYLELLWIESPGEAASPSVAPLRLPARADGGASPFGVALRPRGDAPDPAPPFATIAVHPPYLPGSAALRVAVDSSDIPEALVFVLPAALRRLADGPGTDATVRVAAHPNGAVRLGTATLGVPGGAPSEALAWLCAVAPVELAPSSSPTLRLVCDRGIRGALSLAPEVPLEVRW